MNNVHQIQVLVQVDFGDEIASESFNSSNISNTNHHTISLPSKLIATTIDDCDSAFSESGSTDKNAFNQIPMNL